MVNQGGQQRLVIVGIDGSECSTAALEWAASHAEATGAIVRAVAVWRHPSTMEFDMGGGAWDREGACRQKAKKQVASVVSRHPDLEIHLDVICGRPAEALVNASEGAALLVVGTRGHAGFKQLMLGSTSNHCAHASHCPVLIYR